MIPVPVALTLGNSVRAGTRPCGASMKASGERRERVPQREWAAQDSCHSELFQRMEDGRGENNKPTLFI